MSIASNNEIRFLRRREPYFEFSNFYRSKFIVDGIVYPSSEHYYQSKKVEGTEWEAEIVSQINPGDAARFGRRKDLVIRSDWEDVKDDVMRKALYEKFNQNHILKNLLVNTGDAIIIENSLKDYYWGCGADDSGKNMLGILLMELRDKFTTKTFLFFT